ncbi:hypothetical protein LA080_010079 [Diaporthe eres]|nr:hypothetical protein LA080_010079 [Diaporthe eres]
MADNDHKGDIKLTGAQETLMLTLIARARDTESAHPILNDTYAASVAKQVKDSGYDFSKRLRYGLLERPVSALISLRTRILDLKTEAFLSAHPGRATVLHLACGLDSRSLRVRWQGEGRLWVDVDKQDVIELRKRVMRDPTAGSGAKARKPLYDYKRNSYANSDIQHFDIYDDYYENPIEYISEIWITAYTSGSFIQRQKRATDRELLKAGQCRFHGPLAAKWLLRSESGGRGQYR